MFSSPLCYPHEFHRLVNHLAAPYPVQSASYYPRRRYTYSRRQEAPIQRYRILISNDAEPNYDTKIDPAIRFYNEAAEYGLEVELPGFSKPQINVEFADNKTLRLSGSTAPVEHETNAVETSLLTECETHVEAPSETTAAEVPRDSASPSPSVQSKRTSIEEVRDEAEADYVEVESPGNGQRSSASVTPRTTIARSHPSQDLVDAHVTKKTQTVDRPVYTRSFDKSFEIPADANRDQVSAELKDGILRIHIGKVITEAGRRRVAVL